MYCGTNPVACVRSTQWPFLTPLYDQTYRREDHNLTIQLDMLA